jgi:hypothetical protein
MLCAPGPVFVGTEGVGARFHVLRSRNRFRRCRVRRVPFSCFVLPDMFSAVPRASGPFFMFCALGLVFLSIEGVGPRFHILGSRNLFRRCRVRRVPFSCFALPDSFSTVPRASGPVFMFCAPELVFGGTEGVPSRFHVFRSRTCFRRYRGRRVPFSCFAQFQLAFGRTVGVASRFHFLCTRTRFRRYLGRQISFSCFPLSDMFSAVPSASSPVFMFCTPRLIFGGTEGVGSHFRVLRSQTRIRRYRGRQIPFSYFPLPDSFSTIPRASGPVFMLCTPGLIFGRTEGVWSRFHVLRSRTRFRRYRGRRVPFSCFALPESFSVVPRASRPVFMISAPGHVFGGTEGVCSRFHVFRSQILFRRLCDPFSRAPHRLLVAMGCGRRTQRSLLNVHFLGVDAGWCRRLKLVGMHI